MDNQIALVDINDSIIGYSNKQLVHQNGLLHRAFSIFVFSSEEQVLVHRRAFDKYHSPGLWTNTCCSHLPQGMDMEDAIHIRLNEEMGFDTTLEFVTKFHYKIEFNNGLVENEIDHIYIGFFNQMPNPNPNEVSGYNWVSLPDLKSSIILNPNMYTYWLNHIMLNHYSDLVNALQLSSVNR